MLKHKLFIIAAVLAVILISGFCYIKYMNRPATINVQLVQGFPAIPIYPKSTLIKSVIDPHEGETYNGVKYSATWNVDAKVPDVSQWYLTNFKSAGWTLDVPPANPMAPDIQLITFVNDTYTLNMSFSKNQNSELTSITSEFSLKFSDTKEPGEDEGE